MARRSDVEAFSIFVCSKCGFICCDKDDFRRCPECKDNCYSKHYVQEVTVHTASQAVAHVVNWMRRERDRLTEVINKVTTKEGQTWLNS